MTKEGAIQFLKEHQPLPDELELDDETIGTFERVRLFFLENPSSECIPLFLGAFAADSGLGVYQMVHEVLWKFDPADVVPHLVAGIRSDRAGTRMWSTEMAADFSSSDLIEPLAETLIDGDHDLKYAAVTALEQIKDIRAREALRAALELVDDNEIRDLIIEVLDSPPL